MEGGRMQNRASQGGNEGKMMHDKGKMVGFKGENMVLKENSERFW